MPSLSGNAISTQSFLSGIGVCTHIPYTDGGYANINTVISDLKYLGVTEVRDGITDGQNGSAPLSSYISMAKAGMHFTFVAGGPTTGDLNNLFNLFDRFAAAAPGAITAIEGPNEINNWPVTFDGVGGIQGALNLQSAIYSRVHSDPALAGAKVAYFTGYSAGAVPVGPDPAKTPGLADYDTQHPYPRWGQAPGPWVARSEALPNTTGATPAVYTETGYSTNDVSPNVQAKYTLDLLMDTAKQGISHTYLYELMDAYAPGSRQGNDGWGLFDYTGAAKPAAVAIHNLTTILCDTSGGGAVPSGLSYEISGLSSTGNSLVMAKANGAYDIVVWAEPQLWDGHQEIAAPAQTAHVTLSQAVAGYSVYDPMSGTTAIRSGGAAGSIDVTVTDHPVIIEVHGAAAAPPAPAPTPTPTPTPTSPTTNPPPATVPAAPESHPTPAAAADGTAANDVISGIDGQANHLRGQDGADHITGGDRFNDINGNKGDDTIVGRSSVGDWLLGGQGADSISAAQSHGHNIINGNIGADSLLAGAGGDIVRGGQGDDLITGGAGADWISGDRGFDTVSGGGGADTFHSGPGLGVTHVTDFSLADGDRVLLDRGSHATLSQTGADVTVDLGGGTQVILANANLDALKANAGWLLYA